MAMRGGKGEDKVSFLGGPKEQMRELNEHGSDENGAMRMERKRETDEERKYKAPVHACLSKDPPVSLAACLPA
eukprot:CAMPEP_0171566402 /NCGR_PEP_ID=MMETSP0961-20121227/545_1 /TAXON_ID=87120 /ORGANISM="Aurantiochytrium limacinum, Strain ATCCMYA-1381" /LENGTH=72 /DNA_ID=CAMNT_0012120129 /DNA_START=558 /DNA_END=774 /DNA_ORIENTATION=-